MRVIPRNIKKAFLLPQGEGQEEGSNRQLLLTDPLSPTLSRRERGRKY
jgi:hypothetical protein